MNVDMNWYHWLIVILPISFIIWLALYVRKYSRGVADYLSAGRVAGRYVISVASLMDGLCVITLVAGCEINYQTGFAMGYWNNLLLPLSVFLGLCGWVTYRFRECRALSGGQFLEMRYNRSLRIFATALRVFAEMLTNCIGPAIAARFFIYLLGLPHRFMICGHEVSTYVMLLLFCITMALVVILAGGRISLIVTDCTQGILSYPIFVILAVFIFCEFSWAHEIAPVMSDRVDGESFLNPYNVQNLRDFNMFGLVAGIIGRIFGNVWLGNDTTTAGRTPHEQKMAGLLGTWRGGFTYICTTLLVIVVLTVMSNKGHADKAHNIRQTLAIQVADEILRDKDAHDHVIAKIQTLGRVVHEINSEGPSPAPGEQNTPSMKYVTQPDGTIIASGKPSRNFGLDTPYMESIRAAMLEAYPNDQPRANAIFQNFRSLYNQQMLPVTVRKFFPPALLAVFIYLVFSLMLTTDDSRIFNSSSTIVQDCVIPFFKKPPSPKLHVALIKWMTVVVCVIFFWGSLYLKQMDFLNLFITIATSIWVSGAGAVILFGLYSKRGTTAGAFASLIAAAIISGGSMLIQRNWASTVVPWLINHNLADNLRDFLALISTPLKPWIDWDVPMNEGERAFVVKFPINSTEISFIASLSGIGCYWLFSWIDRLITKRPYFNLDRMLHRGIYNLNSDKVEIKEKFTWRKLLNYLVSITPDYSKGDKAIAWSIFVYSIIYKFGLAFVGVVIWNIFSPWTIRMWSNYYLITSLIIPSCIACITTVWFLWGGIRDMKRLFRDLAARKRDDLDNGMVSGQVSLADKAEFERREQAAKAQKS